MYSKSFSRKLQSYVLLGLLIVGVCTFFFEGANFAAFASGNPPSQGTPLLVSSLGTNTTSENLICTNQSTSDPEADNVTNIYHWYKNDTSLTTLLMPFDTNSSATVKDYSGWENTGTANTTWNSAGKVGGCYSFDGTGTAVSVPDASSLDGDGTWTAATVEQWIYLNVSQTGTQVIAKMSTTAEAKRSYQIGIQSATANQLYAAFIVGVNSYQELVYTPVLNSSQWYHVTMTYKSADRVRLYIDGVQVVASASVVTGNIQASPDKPLLIGRRFDGRSFKGKIDEVRIYNYSLSAAQILQRYTESKDGFSDSSKIVPPETALNDVWKCEVTPNDGSQDGTSTFSNTLTITQTYKLTVNIVGSGTVTKNPDQATYSSGTNVTLTANATTGWSFTGWSGDLTGSENPTVIAMTSNKTVNATFSAIEYSLLVSIMGNGSVTKSPDQATYAWGTNVTLTAYPDSGWVFSSWSGDVSDTDNPTVINMTSNKTVTVTFSETTEFSLTVSIVGNGSVTKNPDQTTYAYGTNVTLTAYPDAGWSFASWSGDISGTENPTVINMTSSKSVTATFKGLLVDSDFNNSTDSADLRTNDSGQDWYESRNDNPSLLTLNTDPIAGDTGKKAALKNYGVVNSTYLTQEFSSTQNGTFSVQFDIDIARIEAYLNYNRTGHIFIGNDWNTNGIPLDTARERYVLLAFYDSTPSTNGDVKLVARTLSTTAQSWTNTSLWPVVASGLSYDTWYTVKVTVDYVAGTYNVTFNGVTTTFSKMDIYNTSTDPAIGFISFMGDSLARGDFYVDNVFSPAVDRYTLTINTVGNGSVARNPGEASYAPGTEVTLTANASTGWVFSEWTGDLLGSTNPANITMNSHKSITATFIAEIPPLGIIADFDSASIGSYNISSNEISFNLTTETLTTGEVYTYWTYFKVTNTSSREVTFRITNAALVNFLSTPSKEAQMVYSYDGIDWSRFTNHSYSSGIYTFSTNFTNNEVYVATFFPFSYTEMQTYTNTVDASQWAVKSVLGSSNQSRDVSLLKITNASIPDSDKKVIYIIGRQHSAETCSSHMLKGMIDFLISDNADAQRMRNAFVWYIVPMVNPDGVYLGKSRATSIDRNANRDWKNNETVEINIVRDHITSINNSIGIDFFIDWHSQMDDTTWANFVYSPSGNTFDSILEAYTDFDIQYPSTAGQGSLNDCTARQWISWNIIMNPMYGFEPTPHLYTWTIASLGQQGVNVAYAINEYFNYTLTVTIIGNGNVSTSPTGPIYTYGTVVTLTATADPGWNFTGWGGNLSGSTNPTTITMDGNKTVTATFTLNLPNLLTYSVVIKDEGSKIYANDTYANGTDFSVPVEVTIINSGIGSTGQFNVSLQIYWTTGSQQESNTQQTVASLSSGQNVTLTFNFRPTHTGYYNLTATADCNNAIVESNETDNNLSRPNIPVTTIGDINGDGVINIFDAVVISLAWGSTPIDSYWNIRADINHDNIVNLLDGIRIASHWGETW